MQKNIHPQYRPVVFRDRSAGESFLTNSTRTSDRTVTWEDGREYPVIDVEVSSASHPFWTGRASAAATATRCCRRGPRPPERPPSRPKGVAPESRDPATTSLLVRPGSRLSSSSGPCGRPRLGVEAMRISTTTT